MDAEQIRTLLPWQWPFLMIDRMIDCKPHSRIITRKCVTAGDSVCGETGAWFPGTLILEGLGQSAALLFRLSYGDDGVRKAMMLGYMKAQLHGSARLGERLTFEVRAAKMTRDGGVFDGSAHVDETLLAEVELALAATQSARPARGDAAR